MAEWQRCEVWKCGTEFQWAHEVNPNRGKATHIYVYPSHCYRIAFLCSVCCWAVSLAHINTEVANGEREWSGNGMIYTWNARTAGFSVFFFFYSNVFSTCGLAVTIHSVAGLSTCVLHGPGSEREVDDRYRTDRPTDHWKVFVCSKSWKWRRDDVKTQRVLANRTVFLLSA